VYKGFKKSTKQEAAIFVFEKKQLERWPKDDRDAMLETLKRGITQLTKIRHPQILTVQHPLEESRESLAFATEPVFASLANVLGNTTNMPTPLPQGIANYKLFEVEIKYGLIQLAEGIGFLHHDVKLLHRNINPESIVINNQGVWKIFGFEFCVLNQRPHEPQPYWPYTEYNATWHLLTQPYLEYMAPECALISSHSPASDIYALGVLIYALHSVGGKPPKMFGKDFGAYKRFAGELKQGRFPNFSAVPDGLQDFTKLMFNAVPEMRPDIHDFPKIPFFDDVGVKTLSYLDALFQWDNLQKSKFYKGLPQVISKMPHRINMFRILPCLVKEFVNPPMIPFVLPNVLLIAENSTDKDFVKHILPHLKPVMKIHDPIQILLIFMQKMELLLKLTPAEDVKSDVLPMLYRALESDAQQIQELCLSILPTFASLIDYPAMKNALLPRIKKLCVNTGLVSVRVNCLLCIGKLLEHLDKWLVMDEVLPFLPKIPSREPAVLMGILGE
jgi:SCY1-like protein 2